MLKEIIPEQFAKRLLPEEFGAKLILLQKTTIEEESKTINSLHKNDANTITSNNLNVAYSNEVHYWKTNKSKKLIWYVNTRYFLSDWKS